MALGIGSLQEQTNRAMTAYAGNQQALDADINKTAKNPRIAPDIAKLAAKSTMDKLLTSLENANLAASMPSPTPTISDQLDSSLRQRLENLINKNAPATQNTMVGNAVATLNNKGGGKGIMGNSPQQGMNVPQPKQTQAAAPPLSQQAIAQRPAQGIMSAPPQQGMPTRMAAGGGVMKYAVGDMVTGLLPNLSPNPAALIDTLNGPDGQRIISEAIRSGINIQELQQAVEAQYGQEVTSALNNTISKVTGPNNVEATAIDPSLLLPAKNVPTKGIETVASEPMPRILREVADPKATAPKGIEAAASSQTDPNAIGNILAYAQEREARKKRANDSKSVMPSVTPEVKDKYGMPEEERRLSSAELLKAAAPQGIETAVAPNALPSQDAVSAPEGVELLDLSAAALKWLGDNPELAASIALTFIPGVGWGALAARGGIRAVAAGVSRLSSTKIGKKAKEALLDSVSTKRAKRENIIGLGGSPVRGYTKGISRQKRDFDPQKLRDRASDAVQLGGAAVLANEILGGEDASKGIESAVTTIPSEVLEEARDTNSVATNGVATNVAPPQTDPNAIAKILAYTQAREARKKRASDNTGGSEDKYALPTVEEAKIDSEAETAIRQGLNKKATREADADFLGRGDKQKRAEDIIKARQRRLDGREYRSSDAFNAGLRAIAGARPGSSSFAAGANAMDSYTTRFNKDKQTEQNAIDALVTSADAADTVLGNNALTSAGKAFNDAITFFSSMREVKQNRFIAEAEIKANAILNEQSNDRADARSRRSDDRADTRSEADRVLKRETNRLARQIEREKGLQGQALAIAKWVQSVEQKVMESPLYQNLEADLFKEEGGPGTGDYDEIKASMDNILTNSRNNVYSVMYANGYLEILENAQSTLGAVSSEVNRSLGLPAIQRDNSFLNTIQAQKDRIKRENALERAASLTQAKD